jgi:hypothetical protein
MAEPTQHQHVSSDSSVRLDDDCANANGLSSTERRRQFALRFKTQLCRSHAVDGGCLYKYKCVFAHGEAELRTEELNQQEGIVSEAAIRDWRRKNRLEAFHETTTTAPATVPPSPKEASALDKPSQPILVDRWNAPASGNASAQCADSGWMPWQGLGASSSDNASLGALLFYR